MSACVFSAATPPAWGRRTLRPVTSPETTCLCPPTWSSMISALWRKVQNPPQTQRPACSRSPELLFLTHSFCVKNSICKSGKINKSEDCSRSWRFRNEPSSSIILSNTFPVSLLEAAHQNPGGEKTEEEEEEEEEDLSLVYAARGQQTILQCWSNWLLSKTAQFSKSLCT